LERRRNEAYPNKEKIIEETGISTHFGQSFIDQSANRQKRRKYL